ncbi:hypothetical protein J2Y46_002379 [Microbacterium sp. BE35]|uniref:hypothetical protein n=1 Tax=Microbacterium sp. BE35 TaxID=2817773 RepID=UPI0028588B5B|nr:hypothetical protein [Microbacterium sp. BE35]MDR7189553.1 hypothetical protein [Microbacterium sp. BE35]
MKRTIVGPDPEPDSRLDPFRMGLARVYHERVLVGFLSTRVNVRREQVRRLLGRPRLVNPVEFIEWFFEMAEDWPRRHPDGWDDGWEHDVEIRSELHEGQFAYPDGAPLKLMWVDVVEASVWEEHYAFAGRHEKAAWD